MYLMSYYNYVFSEEPPLERRRESRLTVQNVQVDDHLVPYSCSVEFESSGVGVVPAEQVEVCQNSVNVFRKKIFLLHVVTANNKMRFDTCANLRHTVLVYCSWVISSHVGRQMILTSKIVLDQCNPGIAGVHIMMYANGT